MTSAISPPNHPPPRRPFALRELFCLMTLACGLCALLLRSGFTQEENYLVGLSVGGAWLGILISRLCGRGVWLAGLALGLLGAGVAIGLSLLPWQERYDKIASLVPARLPEFWNQLKLKASGGMAVGVGLAIVACLCYQLPLWATATGEHGMFGQARRHPYRLAAVLLAVTMVLLVAWNIDFLLWPASWTPRTIVPLSRKARETSESTLPASHLALSRHGKWLAVYLSDYLDGQKSRFKGTLLFRLDGQVQPIDLNEVKPDQIYAPAFSVDAEDTFAFLSYEVFSQEVPDSVRPGVLVSTTSTCDRVQIVNLASHTPLRTIVDPQRSEGTLDADRLDWLPGGGVMHAAWSRGAVVYDAATGEETRRINDKQVFADVRLGHRYQVEGKRVVRVVDLATERDLRLYEYIQPGALPDRLTASRDGRMLLNRNNLFGNDALADLLDGELWTFTAGGRIVASRHFDDYPTWNLIPFGDRVAAWLNRDSFRLLDGESGEELARSRPLRSPIDNVTISHDGAHLAVLTRDGVFVYDLPERFR
jgi:hypothetical protein